MSSLLLSNPLFGVAENGRGIYVFGLEIYYYALCIVTGMICAAVLSGLLMKRRNMSPDLVFTLFIFCIPSALICARLYYCITKPLPIQEWFDVRGGGLSIIGGVIGGVTAGLVVCLVKKISFFRAADCVVITILFAQVIGRLGNYFNQEVFGQPVTNPAHMWTPFAVYIQAGNPPGAPEGWYYAFCFYEMFVNLIGFALLYTAAWFWNKKPNGVFTFAYFLWYGIVRTVMEPLRYEGDILKGGGIMWSLVTSILFIVFGAVGIGVLLFLNYKKEGSLIGSKKGDPCGITKYLTPNKDETPYFSKINMLGANYPPKPKKGEEPAEKEEEAEKPPETETEEVVVFDNRKPPAQEEDTQTEESAQAEEPARKEEPEKKD